MSAPLGGLGQYWKVIGLCHLLPCATLELRHSGETAQSPISRADTCVDLPGTQVAPSVGMQQPTRGSWWIGSHLRSLRLTLLASLGLPLACGGEVDEAGTGSSASTRQDSSGSTGTSNTTAPIGVGGTGTVGTTTGAGGTSGRMPLGCENPIELLVGGVRTGIYQCEAGFPVRVREPTCPNMLPDKNVGGADGGGDFCETHEDCAGALTFCQRQGPVATCVQGCETDADCDAGFVCHCADPIGVCSEASCSTNDDCEPGSYCAAEIDYLCTTTYHYACQDPRDECQVDADCYSPDAITPLSNPACVLDSGIRSCQTIGVCGRPFLVAETPRLARSTGSADWLDDSLTLDCSSFSAADRRHVGQYWLDLALMEHASIAAFARLSLQLLALGAPVNLIEQNNSALVDETRHARQAFALATALLGEPVGPGPLVTHDALGATSLEELMITTILEGCVGETVAAVEAALARDRTTSSQVHAVLCGIAADEARHAQLAWQFVAYCLEQRPSLASVLLETCERELALALGAPEGPPEVSAFSELGTVSSDERDWLRTRVLDEVVLPCARRLAAHATSSVDAGASEGALHALT